MTLVEELISNLGSEFPIYCFGGIGGLFSIIKAIAITAISTAAKVITIAVIAPPDKPFLLVFLK